MKFLSIFAVIFISTSPAHAEQPQCGTSGLSNQISDLRKIQCAQTHQTYGCEKQKAIDFAHANDYASCESQEDLENLASTGKKLFSCGKEFGGVVFDSLLGFVYLPKTAYDLALGRIEWPRPFSSCYEDRVSKEIVLGELRPSDMTDVTVSNMSCSEIEKFVRMKVEVTISKLESRRQSEMIQSGKENLQYEQMSLSESERQALSYDKNHLGVPGFQCLKAEVAAAKICAKLTHTGMAAAALYTAPALIAKGSKLLGAVSKTEPVLPSSVSAANVPIELAKTPSVSVPEIKASVPKVKSSITDVEVKKVFGTADNTGLRIRNAISYVQSRAGLSAAEKAADLEVFFKEIKKIDAWDYKRFSGTDGSIVLIGPGDLTGSPAIVIDSAGKIFKGKMSEKIYERFQPTDLWPADYSRLSVIPAPSP